MKVTFEQLSNQLTERGIRPSYQRIKVLEYLYNHHTHPKVEQIFNDLVKEVPTLSKSTIYNTLNIFVEAKLVRTISIEENETRYDIMTEDHGHFKCENCGTITNFHVQMDRLVGEEMKQFIIHDKSVYFKGICPSCRNS